MTLATTIRALQVGTREALLTDTVGFISRLPTFMIDAFKSTLQESLAANLIVLLIDASEDMQDIQIKYAACWPVLDELKVNKSKVLVVLTKHERRASDEATGKIMEDLRQPNSIAISSKSGYGLHHLKTLMGQRLSG